MCLHVTSARSCIEKLVWGLLCFTSSGEDKPTSPFWDLCSSQSPAGPVAWLPEQGKKQSLHVQLSSMSRFSSLPGSTSTMWCPLLTSGVGERREGFLRMKWVIAGKTVKPSANAGVNGKEKEVPSSIRLGHSPQVITAVFCLSPKIWSSGCCSRQSF